MRTLVVNNHGKEQKIRFSPPFVELQLPISTTMKILLFLLLSPVAFSTETETKLEYLSVFDEADSVPCNENGVVNSWCDSKVNDKLRCVIHPSFNLYGCRCEDDPASCPEDCYGGVTPVQKSQYGVECLGIPEDEPNYILRGKHQIPPHHCENNALVANWCNENTNPHVTCLLLPALDEYVCSCYHKHAACPEDCVGGAEPDKKTKFGIRCKNIPEDKPNYVLDH